MPELTPKLGIKKPLGNETVSRAAFNENWDIIDQGVVADKGGAPSIQAGLDANKPAAGTAGRLYVATDTQMIYRDTGTAWVKVGVVKWGDIEGKPSSFTPSTHKSTHATGGSDALVPADIGAAPASHFHSGTDITSKVASASVADSVSWSGVTGKPSSFTPSTHKSTHATGGSDALVPADIGAAPASHTHTPADIGAIANSAGSVTDTNIGNRTADQAQTPTGATGTITQLFSWIANRIKAILGTTNWYDAAPTTLSAAKSHIDAQAPHPGHALTTHTHSGSDITSAVSSANNADTLDTYHANTSITANTIPVRDASGNVPGNITGNAATATKLQTARTISLSGDTSGSASFDGSANATIAVTLANSGVTAGTYKQVTVDAKGRVTAGSNPTTLSGYGITDAIQNAGSTPSIQSGPDASKPAAGIIGRLYIATDTNKIYRDTGSVWQLIGSINWNDITGKPASFTPAVHKSTHATGGSDALTPADIGAATASHTHTKSQITDFPSSLPANGGNADTVDNKHASDFAPAGYGLGGLGIRLAGGIDLNTIISNGWYDVQNPVNGVSGLTWHKLLVVASADGNYITQLVFSMTEGSDMYMRHRVAGTWGSWYRIAKATEIPTSLPANGGNADTVDGKHASDLVQKAGDTMTGALTVPNLIAKVTIPSSSGPSAWPAGFVAGTVYNNGYPVAYGTIFSYKGTTGNSCVQILQAWPGTDGGEAYLYIRSARDTGTDVFGPWRKVWSENNDGAGSGLDADMIRGIKITSSTTAPSTPAVGDIWFDLN